MGWGVGWAAGRKGERAAHQQDNEPTAHTVHGEQAISESGMRFTAPRRLGRGESELRPCFTSHVSRITFPVSHDRGPSLVGLHLDTERSEHAGRSEFALYANALGHVVGEGLRRKGEDPDAFTVEGIIEHSSGEALPGTGARATRHAAFVAGMVRRHVAFVEA